MKRLLATARQIHVPTEILGDILVLTPNRASAARLNVSHRTLSNIAVEILNQAGIGIVSLLRSRYVLRSTVASLIPDRDATAEANRMRPIIETILRDGIDIAAMKNFGSQSAQRLAEVAEMYTAELWREQLIDKESALWTAAALIKQRRKILVYGYFRARFADVHFIDSFAGDGSIFVAPSGQAAIFGSANRSIEWMIKRGWEDSDEQNPAASEIAKIADRFAVGEPNSPVDAGWFRAYSFPNIDAEVRATLGSAKQMIATGTAPDRIAIVSRKAKDYERSIRSIAREYGLPVSSRSKVRLVETKLGGYISIAFEAIAADLEFTVTARLLRHPYGSGLSEEQWTAARRRRASGADEWNRLGVDLESFLLPQNANTVDNWTAWLLKIIPPMLIREKSAKNAADLLAYESFRTAIDELGDLNGKEEMAFESFADTVIELLETSTTVADPGRGGIEFHQPDSMIGGEFDHVFVVGMAEGMLPAITDEDAVVDFHEQRRLEARGVAFDRPAEFPRWEALSFYYVLLTASRGITLSYPKTVDIEEKLASPVFDRLGVIPVTAKPETISSRREEMRIRLRHVGPLSTNDCLSRAIHQYTIESRRESSEPFDEFDGNTGIGIGLDTRVWSASQMTKIGQCPFKWFAEKVLRLSTGDEGDTELRGSVLGRLYHKTLQLAVERALNSESFRATVLSELECAFLEAEANDEIAVKELPNWEHRRAEHLNILRKAVEAEDFIAEGSHAVATEQSFEVKWNGFNMRGSIDRVDKTVDGLFAAIDYKTGVYIGRVKDENSELKIDIQLPIYSKVALESMHPGQVANGHYYSIRQQKIIREKPVLLNAFAETVKDILESGNFAVDPDNNKKSCNFCDFDPLCRQGQRNARKRK